MSSEALKIDDELTPSDELVENSVDELQPTQDGSNSNANDSILKSYLRLLTWEELVEIASVFDSTSMIPLTDFLTKEVLINKSANIQEASNSSNNKSAQIIPFIKDGISKSNDESNEQKTSDDYEFDKYDQEIIEAKEKNVIEVNKNGSFSIYDREEELHRKKHELKKINIGEFILKQKNKLKQCQKKLKKKEIYLLYKNNSSVDIRANKNEDEKQKGINVSSNCGLLINKRQK
ncbi:MAG: hypothetical protein A2202_04150 [Bdellovibrionales bacterium RIFOXYA1_FULL_36_14]|nr:MAG: hypothetical protein A2202_04150 [Bdellovibrionales bacterium RIFOXYA1_FULL_36_14]